MAARLIPALDAFARFYPDLSREEAEGRLMWAQAIETALAVVVDGDWTSASSGVLKTIDVLAEVSPAPDPATVPVAIFITGDVIAPNASLEEYDTDWSPLLKILGSVTVRNLYLYGSRSEIDGDLVASGAVLGVYNHGSLRVRGGTRAGMILDSDYTWEFDGPVFCPYVLGDLYRCTIAATHPRSELVTVLVQDAIDDRDNLNYGFIWETVCEGGSILREASGVGEPITLELSARASAALDEADRRVAAGEAVTHLDLKGCEMRFVPDRLRRLQELRRLSLAENNVSEIPDWLAELTELEELSIRRCGLSVVPAVLGRLPRLRTLDLSENDIVAIADDLEPLLMLEELTAGAPYCWAANSMAVQTFTAEIDLGTFPRIRAVSQLFNGDRVHYFPKDRLWSSASLEYLQLSFKNGGALPDGLSDATALRVLDVGIGAADADHAAKVLARIPTLRLLNLDIFSELSREAFDRLRDAVPNAFIRHWAVEPDFSPAQKAAFDTAKDGWSDGRHDEALAAAETCLAGMDFERAYASGPQLEELLLIKTEGLLRRASAEDARHWWASTADWGARLLALIPDEGEHLWRHPFTALAYVRALAALCLAFRPLLGGETSTARAVVAAVRLASDRQEARNPLYRHRYIREWAEKVDETAAR